MVKNIRRLNRRGTSLFGPEDEVDPAAEVATDVLRFERFPLLFDKQTRTATRPWWKFDAVHRLAVLLTLTEGDVVRIREKVGQEKELGS